MHTVGAFVQPTILTDITADVAHGVKVAERIDISMEFVIHLTWTRAGPPFGGVKMSGYGHELASFGIQEFVNKSSPMPAGATNSVVAVRGGVSADLPAR